MTALLAPSSAASSPSPSGPTWRGGAPPVPARAVVVAPHPDDEVLGTAGLLRWLVAHGASVALVAVTDGEASHARSRRTTPDRLRRVRDAERRRALAVLDVEVGVERLGLPDGHLGGHEDALGAALVERADPDTTLVAPWRHDGHPDHDATGRAAARAAEATGAALWEVAIWAKVRAPGPAAAGAHHLDLDEGSAAAKRAAAACFASQLRALGPHPDDGPVVHPGEVAAMLAGPELVRWA